VNWIRAKAEEYVFPARVQAIILDPPRSGLHKNVQRQLLERKPEWITYISCDCTTFSRDLTKLEPFYDIRRIAMMDLFPQTYHFEIIALLEKRKEPLQNLINRAVR